MLKSNSTPDTLTLTHTPWGQALVAVVATVVFTVLAVMFFASGNDAGVIFVVFAVSGPVFMYFFLESRKVIFDRTAGTVTLNRRAPRGSAATVHSLDGIARAEIHRATPSPENRVVDAELAAPRRGNFRAVLVYENGTELPLSDAFVGGQSAFEEVRAVNTWLEAA